jgi:hypothetical protein
MKKMFYVLFVIVFLGFAQFSNAEEKYEGRLIIKKNKHIFIFYKKPLGSNFVSIDERFPFRKIKSICFEELYGDKNIYCGVLKGKRAVIKGTPSSSEGIWRLKLKDGRMTYWFYVDKLKTNLVMCEANHMWGQSYQYCSDEKVCDAYSGNGPCGD